MRWIALAWPLFWPLAPATAQESGLTWTVMRYAYVLDDKGLSTGTFEIERQAHDAQAARSGARVDLPYVAGQETIEILDAATVKADRREFPVGPDPILDIAPQVPRDVALYNDTRTKSVVFPDVAAGDSIRYVYRLKRFSTSWPETTVADFNHVILYVPELDLYIDPTWNYAAFGVLPWGQYDKPVVHAVDGKSRVGRTPLLRAEDNVSEVATVATISADGRISGTTREHAKGAMATDLKDWTAAGLTVDRAATHLRSQGTPGPGVWISPNRDDTAREVLQIASFKLAESIDLAAGEALVPLGGLRFLPRPGGFLLGV